MVRYGNFLLAKEDYGVPTADADGSESAGLDCLEGILNLIQSSLRGEDSNEVLMTLIGFAHQFLKII